MFCPKCNKMMRIMDFPKVIGNMVIYYWQCDCGYTTTTREEK